MTNQQQTPDAREAEDMGEKPDLGRKPDALSDALSGSGMGSDTRAGSLEGGAATGSDIDPDQDVINESLASADKAPDDPQAPSVADPDPIKNTGADTGEPAADPVGGRPDQVDAATG